MAWKHRIRIRHLFTEKEDHKSVQQSMDNVANALESSDCFRAFDATSFRNIPKGDDYFGPVDCANKMLDEMYDFADSNRIWIEL